MANTTLTLLAAGSLRSAFLPLVAHFRQHTGLAVDAQFGPAGLLRERIEAGSPCAVFASANAAHPQALLQAGLAQECQGFASNQLMLTAAVAGQRWPGLAGAAQHAPPAVGDLHARLRSVGRLYLAAVRPN
ncbi:Molybdenum-binding periplasmic protein [Klebsiella pneumoniae subsp. pneumoniae ST258-K28BO]|nr:Molybdenum-binding periplasmic protein [Klebsiella pneumoniae subsp. pneumoniae ST258-K28BO]